MSFGPSSTTKTAENNLSGTSNLALNTQFPQVEAGGSNLLNLGNNTTAPGVNFFNTLLNGNRTNTTAMLQPNIDQIRGDSSRAITAINTLAPRGGGRGAADYAQSFAPEQSILNLFNPARSTAAAALPQIGQGEINSGTNLFGLGNGALNVSSGANSNLAEIGQRQQQISNGLWSSLGQGLFGLATTPFGGGTSANGLLGLIGKH